MFQKLIGTNRECAMTVIRIALGVVFLAHGSQKMLGWFGGDGYQATMDTFINKMHIPAPFAFLAIAAEFFGGLGLIVGLLSRIAAFGIFVTMAVAILMVHRHFGFFMNWQGTQPGEGFEYHILAMAMALAVMIQGAGCLSLDHWLTSRHFAHSPAGNR